MRTLLWKLVPWRVQQALAWCVGNRHIISALFRRYFKNPEYRIMISTAFFGGVGGTEKHLKALVESMPDAAFDIKARQLKPVGFIPDTRNYTLNCCSRHGDAYDLYVYFAGGGRPELELDNFTFRKKLIYTNGADIRDIEQQFDHIAIQTPNYRRYCNSDGKTVLVFPPIRPLFPETRKAIDLPEKYFLTVFNPFSEEFKGNDLILRMAEAAVYPIVWCFSDKSGLVFGDVPEHPNLVKRKNLSQEELYYAYDHATAYVSLSRAESFGWSLAEAFYSDLPIITREVGFIGYVKDQEGINLYETEEQLEQLLKETHYRKIPYDDGVFRENAFPQAVKRILQS